MAGGEMAARARHVLVARYGPGRAPEGPPDEVIEVWLDAEGRRVTDPEAIAAIRRELGWG